MREKKQSIYTNTDMNQILELSDKDFKEELSLKCFNDQIQILWIQINKPKVSVIN